MAPRLDARLAADLVFFRAVVEAGGFVKAGDRLAVTQSAVTQRVQRLERSMGCALLVRGGRDLRLTAAGQDLFAAVRDGFDGIGEAMRRAGQRDERETLRVSCIPSLASEWLAPRLKSFSDTQSGIDIVVYGETHDVNRASMARDDVDVAIRYGRAAPPGAAVAFDHPEPVFPVCSPVYRDAQTLNPERTVVLLHDAAPWASASAPSEEWNLWLQEHGVPWGGRAQNHYFNLAQLTLQASVGGSGIALGRTLIVAPYLADGRLVAACKCPALAGLRYFVLVRDHSATGPATAFVNWLGASMKGAPD